MADLSVIVLFDLSIVISMLILAFLSRKMGEALKIRPYYLILYVTALCVTAASGIDIAEKAGTIAVAPLFSVILRCCAGVAAFGVCLRYWNWLFSEFFGR